MICCHQPVLAMPPPAKPSSKHCLSFSIQLPGPGPVKIYCHVVQRARLCIILPRQCNVGSTSSIASLLKAALLWRMDGLPQMRKWGVARGHPFPEPPLPKPPHPKTHLPYAKVFGSVRSSWSTTFYFHSASSSIFTRSKAHLKQWTRTHREKWTNYFIKSGTDDKSCDRWLWSEKTIGVIRATT